MAYEREREYALCISTFNQNNIKLISFRQMLPMSTCNDILYKYQTGGGAPVARELSECQLVIHVGVIENVLK